MASCKLRMETRALDKILGWVRYVLKVWQHGEMLVSLETRVIMLSEVFICPNCDVN
jgi:hypothetical protein